MTRATLVFAAALVLAASNLTAQPDTTSRWLPKLTIGMTSDQVHAMLKGRYACADSVVTGEIVKRLSCVSLTSVEILGLKGTLAFALDKKGRAEWFDFATGYLDFLTRVEWDGTCNDHPAETHYNEDDFEVIASRFKSHLGKPAVSVSDMAGWEEGKTRRTLLVEGGDVRYMVQPFKR